jgi:hypothetical protein
VSIIVGAIIICGIVAMAARWLWFLRVARVNAKSFEDSIAAVLRLPRADVRVSTTFALWTPWVWKLSVRVAGKPHAGAESLMVAMWQGAQKLAAMKRD